MRRIVGHFKGLNFSDGVDLEEVSIEDDKIVLEVSNVGVLPKHPLNTGHKMQEHLGRCRLIFEGVKSSRRVLYEYAVDPWHDDFKAPRTIIDGPFREVGEPVTLFGFECVSTQPPAWVDWEIESVTFILEIED